MDMDAVMDTFELRDLLADIDALFIAYRDSGHPPTLKEMCTLRASAALKLGPLVAGPSPIPDAILEAIEEHE